jgi:hypothetical protein
MIGNQKKNFLGINLTPFGKLDSCKKLVSRNTQAYRTGCLDFRVVKYRHPVWCPA